MSLPAGRAATKFNVNINTIYKWRRRDENKLLDKSHRTRIKSFTLNEEERVIVCEIKKLTLFSLDDLVQVLRPLIPKITRDIIYTVLKQERLNRNEYLLPKEALNKYVHYCNFYIKQKSLDYEASISFIKVRYLL